MIIEMIENILIYFDSKEDQKDYLLKDKLIFLIKTSSKHVHEIN
jgi:hypothetical protein